VDGTNVTGKFTSAAHPENNGTLTGTIKTSAGDYGPIVSLRYVTTQPREAKGIFDVFTDGKLEGRYTWRNNPGDASAKSTSWTGTRASQ
jgi:hypothetical protein